ncbi:hypothetical protein MM239_06410 [Belliella sp. DSM 111904]|uniref:Uncharacterized protein n=1 Tax=Belliella filtrata TaxID=2923435 RepID=A0ABS9UY73_9BACT|nr:hypothetical protein [Belliella filtrata]MCH7409018.1 hypothetical protein [Belliella filtrata]
MKKIVQVSFFVFGMVILSFQSIAQCAMCRASVENNVSNGETSIGAGLNTGILYLFTMPYLIAAVIGYFWYKNAKNRRLKELANPYLRRKNSIV